jgi:serine kinase of HPr protein (carbohydrate metabolism regulator)
MILHAGLVALRLGGLWRGALIEGPSGAGKSDLALRALDQGFRLVADDRTLVWQSGGRLFGRAPDPLIGLIEARGQGVLAESPIPFAEVALLVRCAGPGEIERLPEPEAEEVAGVRLPRLLLDPREPSAPAKLRRAMQHLGATAQQAYQASSRGGGGRTGTGDSY